MMSGWVVEVPLLLNLMHRDVDCVTGENWVLPISHKVVILKIEINVIFPLNE